ncbi:MAG: hypothetical protein COB49_00450 [Alphaproteobacteria bacterium]|nr:MAG: hypothetical protein COB49_00450 [Alphaproteobacteria bacterium]
MKTLHGEILPPVRDMARRSTSSYVSFWPVSFDGEKQRFTIIPGHTIDQIVGLAVPQKSMWPGVVVWLETDNGRTELSPEYWQCIKPLPGVNIEITYTPMGGDGNKILRGILTIVVAVAAFYTGGLAASALGLVEGSLAAGLVTGLVAGAIGAIGFIALNALVPLKSPVSAVQDTPTSSTGFSNRLAFGQPIPTVHGKLRIYPNMAAQNFFESVGDDRYQRSLFLIGQGPCELSDLKIGSQNLDEFEDVTLEIMQGWDDDPIPTLYQREVTEEGFGTLLETGVDQIFMTPLDSIETQIDFLFTEGLILYDSKGKRRSRTVAVNIEFRKVGDTIWNVIPAVFGAGGFGGRILFPFFGAGFGSYSGFTGNTGDFGTPVTFGGTLSHSFSAKSDRPIIRNKKITFPEPGQYEIRCKRTTAAGDDQTRDKVQVAVLRSFKINPPVKISGLCLVALRIRLTGQKSTQISNFNCVVQKLSAYHDGANWIEPKTTRDAAGDMTPHRSRTPAAAYCDVYRGAGVRRNVPDNRLHMTSIQEWWDYGAANDSRTGEPRYTYDALILARTTVNEIIREICTVGRARVASPNGQYGVVRDQVQSVPVNMFTARNSKNLSGSFNLGTPVHGIKIKFANEAKGGQEEIYIAYADGFDETNATEFEELSMRGMVDVARVHDLGRYFLGVLKLRPETLQITTYVDAMHNQVGDFVVINHDIPRHGLSAGRILSLTTDINGDITSITIDEVAAMVAGKEYAVSIRRPSNSNMVVNAAINTVAGDQQLLTFTTPIVSGMAPSVNDLVTFGEKDKVTRDVLITGIRHLGKDYIFELTCVDLANAIHDVEAETFPAFDNSSTPDQEITPPGVVTNLKLTENIIFPAGVAKSEVWATWTAPVGIPIAQFEIYDDDGGVFTLLGNSLDNRYRLPGQMSVDEDITVRVVAVSLAGNKLPVRLATSATILLDGIADAIAALSGLGVTSLPEALKINWNASAALAAKGTHLYRATADVQPTAIYKSFALPIDEFRDDIGSAGQTYFYWVRPYDQDDVIGPWNATPGVSGITGVIDYGNVANGPPAGATVGATWGVDVDGDNKPLDRIAATLTIPGSADNNIWVRILQVTGVNGRGSGILRIAGVGNQDVPGELVFEYNFDWGSSATIHFTGSGPNRLVQFRVSADSPITEKYLDIKLGTFTGINWYNISVIPEKVVSAASITTIPLTKNVTIGAQAVLGAVNLVGVVKGHHFSNEYTQTLRDGSKIVNGQPASDILGNAIDTTKVAGIAAAAIADAAGRAAAGLDSSGVVSQDVPTQYIPSITIDKLISGNLGAIIELTGASRINYRLGGYIKKTGLGFGSSNQFLEWYGPDIAENLMTEANAISYLTTAGDAFFGGSLSIGTLTNGIESSSVAVPTTVETAEFGSNGGTIQINLSYTFNLLGSQESPDPSPTPNPTAVVELWRKLGTAAYTLVTTLNVTGSSTDTFDPDPFLDDYRWTQTMADSLTYTDPDTVTTNRTYKAILTTRTNDGFNFISQRLGVIATE